jgi:hypothetical protein
MRQLKEDTSYYFLSFAAQVVVNTEAGAQGVADETHNRRGEVGSVCPHEKHPKAIADNGSSQQRDGPQTIIAVGRCDIELPTEMPSSCTCASRAMA